MNQSNDIIGYDVFKEARERSWGKIYIPPKFLELIAYKSSYNSESFHDNIKKEANMESKIEVSFDQKDMEIIKELITELKLYNEKSRVTNNYHIECGAFMGNENDAREFALLIQKYMNEQNEKEKWNVFKF